MERKGLFLFWLNERNSVLQYLLIPVNLSYFLTLNEDILEIYGTFVNEVRDVYHMYICEVYFYK